MLWILLLISQCVFGFSVTHFVLKSCVDLIVEFIIGIPFGFAFSAFIFYYMSSIFAISALHILLHIALLLAASFILIALNGLKNFTSKILSLKPNKTVIFFAIASIITSYFIVFQQYYVDLPRINKFFQYEFNEEYTLMNSFYIGCNSGFTNPFKIRHPYCYKCLAKSHWLTALHSAMLLTAFSTEKVAITIPSFLLFVHFCFVFLYFSRTTLLKNSVYSVLSLFVFLFAGGFGFIRWFWRDPRRDYLNDFVYILSYDKHTYWSHPIFHYLLAYRPSFMSLSLIIDISFLLYKVVYSNGDKSNTKSELLNTDNYAFNLMGISFVSAFSGMLYGLTIPTQIEVSISFAVFLAVFFVILFLKKEAFDKKVANLLAFLIGFFLIFLPQVFILFRFRNCDVSIFTFKNFWQPLTLSGRFYGEIVIWFEALGIFAIITICVSWIHFVYVAFVSTCQSTKVKESAVYAIKFYLPSFCSFLFINKVQFHKESRQDIIAFYPCWMIFSSIIFIYTFDSFVESVKPTVKTVASKKKDSLSSDDSDEIQNKTINKDETDLIINVHLRNKNTRSEESYLEEIQGILIGWFIFFFVITVASAMIGYSRLNSKMTSVYTKTDMNVSQWIISNTNIKDLFYIDPNLGQADYNALTLSGRVVVQDPSQFFYYNPNEFISSSRSYNLKATHKLSRAGFIQEKYYQDELLKLASNLTSNEIFPKLKYVVSWNNSNQVFKIHLSKPDNWKLVYDKDNVLIHERLNAIKKKN